MKRKSFVDKLRHNLMLVRGKAAKNAVYGSHTTFPSQAIAEEAFAHSVAKLLNVADWSGLSTLTANFSLYDSFGRPKQHGIVQTGDFIRIALPGPVPRNWVQVIEVLTTDRLVSFTVQPCPDPLANNPDQVAHFFQSQARSTFRVELRGVSISAFEIGENESINNRGKEAGNRAVMNTIIAGVGWLFYQKIQWKCLTDYLVHL